MKIWITDAHGRTHIYRTPRKPTLLSEFYCGDVRHHGQLSGKRGERKQEVVVGRAEKDIKRIFSRYTRLHSELRVLSGHLRTAWTFRSEEHTSELQSQFHLLFPLLFFKQ